MFFYFTDPVLRAPILGSMLMCMSASIVGVLLFVRKRSLLGETLSHASYPGVGLAILLAAVFHQHQWMPFFVFVGGIFSCLVGFFCVELLVHRWKVSEDAALCFVLSSFFGVGVTIASIVQSTHPVEYQKIQVYLYGQAATMTDRHIVIYSFFSALIVSMIFLFYKELQTFSFDYYFAKTCFSTKMIRILIMLLVVMAIMVGIRSVGIILLAAMFIAPVAAARQITQRLSSLFFFSGFFGLCSGFLGNLLSLHFSYFLSRLYPGWHPSIATGPMIVFVACLLAIFFLLFSPQRGWVVRCFRMMCFRWQCLQENLLKTLWRFSTEEGLAFEELAFKQGVTKMGLYFLLWRLKHRGLVQKKPFHSYGLTEEGRKKGARIVRLHRLWEAYLVNQLGIDAKQVHKNAEEMEHILTPEVESKLTDMLHNPKKDPHCQPIPEQEG